MRIKNTKDKEVELINEIISINCKEITENSYINRLLVKIKSYDINLYIHSINVAVISVIISLKSFSDKKDLNNLFKSALLYDYGKLFILKKIINKSGLLTAKERLEMEKHIKLGYRQLLSELCLNSDILLGILDHYEKNGWYRIWKRKARGRHILLCKDNYDSRCI